MGCDGEREREGGRERVREGVFKTQNSSHMGIRREKEL